MISRSTLLRAAAHHPLDLVHRLPRDLDGLVLQVGGGVLDQEHRLVPELGGGGLLLPLPLVLIGLEPPAVVVAVVVVGRGEVVDDVALVVGVGDGGLGAGVRGGVDWKRGKY